MPLVRIQCSPSHSQMFWFGGLLVLFLSLVGAALRWRFGWQTAAMVLWCAAAVIGAIYYLVPKTRKPIFVGWQVLFFPLGFVTSYIVLAAAFFLAFVPVGWVMRLVGHDPLQRRFSSEATTYWTPHRPPSDSSRYFKQF